VFLLVFILASRRTGLRQIYLQQKLSRILSKTYFFELVPGFSPL